MMPSHSSPAYEIARYLESMGVGVFAANSGWSISVGQADDHPDTLIALRDDGGGSPDTDELDIQTFNVQIRVRGAKDAFNEAHAKQAEIRDLLIEPAPLVTAGMTVIGMEMVGSIAHIGRDENDRPILMATYSGSERRQV